MIWTGQGLGTTGTLTASQLTYLFGQLFGPNDPATGLPTKTQAYTDPTGGAANVVAADNYLKALRGNSAALAAFNDLTGQGLGTSGTLTANQLTYLFGQLFGPNDPTTGLPTKTQAYTDPAGGAANVLAADNYLIALRANSAALAAFNNITGEGFGASGTLSASQLAYLFGELFTIDPKTGALIQAAAYNSDPKWGGGRMGGVQPII